ncbi:hypothetical protein PHYSODRAFT_337463 [Phytophthora sojae]|uniref:Uncharacterized protein n=1 Tax=Phytophthora sojae (strain P6497) TaxID=1094619 RepID=G5A182_PHYSP|nr:hypothetical protein PHYSODRAFT_337463 [Phytophthora sojae]EGZ10683.1 hypothetical protein PHYSODRAFT_337463 [Phytophthora sojae]|eukprot:XP_009533428.1 hypothetical protein PHYSODRAFT_337463 [Phytophthora sojae]
MADRYADQPELLAHLPAENKIKNRKAVVMGNIAQQQKVENFSDLAAWASTTQEAFFRSGAFGRVNAEREFAKEPAGHKNGILVLSAFGGIYKWPVVFEHGANEFLECEEFAQLIAPSRQSGLDVTCSAESSQSPVVADEVVAEES